MMFAIITSALITGAFANRVTLKAYFLFLLCVINRFTVVHVGSRVEEQGLDAGLLGEGAYPPEHSVRAAGMAVVPPTS
jgi:ammonia channel protein AmtB